EQTVKTVVPTRGAIVRANYRASVGVRMLMTLTQRNGQLVPFGAMASIEGAEPSSFIVGDSGQVYLTGLDPQVNLIVKWGNQSANTCRVYYAINMTKQNNDVIIDNAVCR
ncbi:TPA: fimbrial assembly protein, partial [Klebsiella quasipneumoniae subsp. similipneumoniae]|nr:fimbrial assembly protein [Klebsiella quasipneumoniae subsp. similipneumoniae]